MLIGIPKLSLEFKFIQVIDEVLYALPWLLVCLIILQHEGGLPCNWLLEEVTQDLLIFIPRWLPNLLAFIMQPGIKHSSSKELASIKDLGPRIRIGFGVDSEGDLAAA